MKMSTVKICLITIVVLMGMFLMEGAAEPSTQLSDLLFESELKGDNFADDCIDETDCDPYGTDMCTRSHADKKWAEACCREYCNFCNKTVPDNQNCQSTPPSYPDNEK